jgi:hypothetical protein
VRLDDIAAGEEEEEEDWGLKDCLWRGSVVKGVAGLEEHGKERSGDFGCELKRSAFILCGEWKETETERREQKERTGKESVLSHFMNRSTEKRRPATSCGLQRPILFAFVLSFLFQ